MENIFLKNVDDPLTRKKFKSGYWQFASIYYAYKILYPYVMFMSEFI